MASAEEVCTELSTIFFDFEFKGTSIEKSPYFKTYGKIGEVLSNKTAVTEACKMLDQDMVDILTERLRTPAFDRDNNNNNAVGKEELCLIGHGKVGSCFDYFSQRGKAFEDFLSKSPKGILAQATEFNEPYPAKDKKYSKLLDEALAKEEAKAGFSIPVDYAWSGLDALPFLANLRTKRPFKDYGASPEHGEFTHRIQWYALSKLIFRSSATAAEVYASLADWYRPDRKQGQKQAAWDALCDRAPNTGFDVDYRNDFRNPNGLYLHLRSKAASEFPALGTFLQSRHIKRTKGNTKSKFFEEGADASAQAASLKLYKKLIPCLSPQQGNRVSDLSGKGILPQIDFLIWRLQNG